MKIAPESRVRLHKEMVEHIKRIENELFQLKACLDPYADDGDAKLFDALEDARQALENSGFVGA